jgi:hypothetical protein
VDEAAFFSFLRRCRWKTGVDPKLDFELHLV